MQNVMNFHYTNMPSFSDGEDRQITATRPTWKGQKKTAVTRERSDGGKMN